MRKTHRAVVVHEAHRTCGFGAELVSVLQEEAFYELEAPIRRVAALNSPIPYSRDLERAVLPQVEDVVQAVRAVAEKA